MSILKEANQLLIVYKMLSSYIIDIIVVGNGSVVSFVRSVGQEIYYVFLIYTQEMHVHSYEKGQEKSEKTGWLSNLYRNCWVTLGSEVC